MREIKFRAWDKEKKKMVNPSVGYGFLNEQIVGLQEDMENMEGKILMQFTGLKDKNGKEIYEGDIVKLLYGEKHETIELFTPIFDLFYGAYLRQQKNQKHICLEDDFMCSTHDYEVIGSIYENPELLK